MQKNKTPCYYGEYLKLEQFLDCQKPVSGNYQETEAHDEMLFIIVHQAYELWFKQILHEIHSLLPLFKAPRLSEQNHSVINQRLNRIIQIQKVLNEQITILETMTPLDFLDFRDYLVPASGFQSIQFKEIEILLGLKSEYRINFDKASFYKRLNEADRAYLMQLEEEPSLYELVESWLERLPFLEHKSFSFLGAYQQAVERMLDRDRSIIQSVSYLSDEERAFQLADLERTRQQFNALFSLHEYERLRAEGIFRLSQPATLAAIFINLYRDQPAFQQPFQILENLLNVDEAFTQWRYRHTVMVHRMLGTKIGTGGSSGHDYLSKTTQNNRFFKDLFNLSTFLIPRSELPELPKEISNRLGTAY